MKKRRRIFKFSRRVIECLAVLIVFGITVAAAGTSDSAVTYTTVGGKWEQADENTWTMDKDKDGKKDITLVKKGNRWDYLFEVADPDADYYAWEENVPEGYQVAGKGSRQDPTITQKSIKYSHTPNINDDGTKKSSYSNNLNLTDVVTIPGATKLHVVIKYEGEDTRYDYACIWEGNHPEYTAPANYSSGISIDGTNKFGGSSGTIQEKEIDINGDTVTFGFKSDSSGTGKIGYGYYAVITGDGKDDGATITNEEINPEESAYGGLKLSKVVTGDDGDSEQNFRFDITLSTTDETVAGKVQGNHTFGEVNFTDGKGIIYLKDGDSVEMKDIPAGMSWKITETAVNGYTTTITGGDAVPGEINTVTGIITKGQTTDVIYTNEKTGGNTGGDTPDASSEQTGSLKVKKVVRNIKKTSSQLSLIHI